MNTENMTSTTDPGVPALPSRATLLSAAFGLFFLSFLMSSNSGVVPQLFFQRVHPDEKTLLLAISLFVSTLAANLAVVLSRRHSLSGRAVVVSLLATVVATLTLYAVSHSVVFVLALIAVQFAANHLTHQLDQAAVARAGALRRFNDAVGTLGRLVGVLVAPAFLTMYFDAKNVIIPVALVIGLGACIGAARLFATAPVPPDVEAGAPVGEQPCDRTDLLVFGYVVTMFSTLYLFAANMIYLFRDLFLMPNAETSGGMAMMLVFGCAVLANVAVAVFKRNGSENPNRVVRVVPLSLPALLLIGAGGSIALGFRTTSLAIVLSAAACFGTAYGVFLMEVREYTSHGVRHGGKTILLSWFNNMANVGSLVAFTIMLGLASVRTQAAASYWFWLMVAVAAIPLVGLVTLGMAGRRCEQSPS